MSVVSSERYRDIGVLLPPDSRARYAAMDTAGRRELERIFFTMNDPIYLTGVEDRRVEHHARIAWAHLLLANDIIPRASNVTRRLHQQ